VRALENKTLPRWTSRHVEYFRVKSTDPIDTPELNFEHFNIRAETDISAMMDTVAWLRRVSDVLAPCGLVIGLELPCPAGFVLMGIVQTLSKINSGFETRLLVIILRALAGLGRMEIPWLYWTRSYG